MFSAFESLFSFLVIGLVQRHEQTELVKPAAKSHDGSRARLHHENPQTKIEIPGEGSWLGYPLPSP